MTPVVAQAVFSNAADFQDMCDVPARISIVKHKAFVEVNEEGTEAAAATAVVMTRSLDVSKRFSMVIDRPFFCAIRDNRTGATLFLGSIVEPK